MPALEFNRTGFGDLLDAPAWLESESQSQYLTRLGYQSEPCTKLGRYSDGAVNLDIFASTETTTPENARWRFVADYAMEGAESHLIFVRDVPSLLALQALVAPAIVANVLAEFIDEFEHDRSKRLRAAGTTAKRSVARG